MLGHRWTKIHHYLFNILKKATRKESLFCEILRFAQYDG